DRSDISEELARMSTHIGHFRELLAAGGEVGKKLDFLLQEMNREANTLLSKTGGIGGKGTRITELGLAMKAEIEQAREQIQNVESTRLSIHPSTDHEREHEQWQEFFLSSLHLQARGRAPWSASFANRSRESIFRSPGQRARRVVRKRMGASIVSPIVMSSSV